MKRKIILRCFLAVLILLNLWMIFSFSNESAVASGETSKKVTETVAQTVVKDFEEKPPVEQKKIVTALHPSVRTMAHMAEFGLLGVLIMLFLLTFQIRPLLCEGFSLLSVLAVASVDELYQHLANAGRAAELKDILYDTFGAIIGCSLLLCVILTVKAIRARKLRSPMKITNYHIPCKKLQMPLRIALASDLHDNPYERVVEALKKESPDLILIPGDLTDDEQINNGAENALAFLRECAAIAPTFYSPGNHEVKCYHKGNHFTHPVPVPIPLHYRQAVVRTGAVFLDNEMIETKGMTVCALSSGLNGKINEPNADAMRAFGNLSNDGLKLLLCHHPEYIPLLDDLGMDLVVCGHAHGGQWRIFGKGVYAPGQGIFPKYTSGVHNGNCVISRGLGDHTWIPRIFNDNELVMIELG